MTKKHLMMNFIFFDMAIAGGLCVYMCHKYGFNVYMTILMGSVLSAVAMFIGMILAFMMSDDREREKRMKIEQKYQLQLKNIAMTERLNGAKVSVNMAKAMADKVANTIVSKFVDGLSDDGKRKNVLDSVNVIIDSEINSLSKAMFEGLKEEKEIAK
jgi:H+/gluconate symporter-like permease